MKVKLAQLTLGGIIGRASHGIDRAVINSLPTGNPSHNHQETKMNRWKPKTPEQLQFVRYHHACWTEFYNATLEDQEESELPADSIFKISNDRHRLKPGEAISIALAKREDF